MKNFFCFLILIPNILLCQHTECSYIKSYHSDMRKRSFNPELRSFVLDCFAKLEVSPPKNFVVYESNIANCGVYYSGTTMTMELGVDWLNKIRLDNDWNSVFIIGHEIGHIMEGHLQKTKDKRHEYEADTWGAKLILAFNYPFDNFNNDLAALFLNSPDSESHPSGLSRLNHINKVLNNSNRSILSPFGAFEFQIDKWNKSKSIRYDNLDQSLKQLYSNSNKDNLIRAIENINYCEKFLKSKKNILSLLAHGRMLDLLSERECYDYIKNIFPGKSISKYALEILPIFQTHDYKNSYFNKFIHLIDIWYYRGLLSSNRDSNEVKVKIISMLSSIYLNDHNSDVLVGFDLNNAISKMMTSNNLGNHEFLSTLVTYYNEIGNHEKSLELAYKTLEIVKDSKQVGGGDWGKEQLSICHYNVALGLFRLKSFSASIKSLEWSLFYTNRSLQIYECRYLLSRCFLAIGEFKKALTYIRDDDNIQDAFELKVRGQIFLANGQVQKAKKAFEKSCELLNPWSCQKLLQLR